MLDPNTRVKQTFTLGSITHLPTTRANRLDPNKTTQRFTRCSITNPPRSHVRTCSMPTKRLNVYTMLAPPLTHRWATRSNRFDADKTTQTFTQCSIPKSTSHTFDSVRSQQTNSMKRWHDAPIDNPRRPHAQIAPIPTKRLKSKTLTRRCSPSNRPG